MTEVVGGDVQEDAGLGLFPLKLDARPGAIVELLLDCLAGGLERVARFRHSGEDRKLITELLEQEVLAFGRPCRVYRLRELWITANPQNVEGKELTFFTYHKEHEPQCDIYPISYLHTTNGRGTAAIKGISYKKGKMIEVCDPVIIPELNIAASAWVCSLPADGYLESLVYMALAETPSHTDERYRQRAQTLQQCC